MFTRPTAVQSGDDLPTQKLLEQYLGGDPEAARSMVERYLPVMTERASRHPWMRVLSSHMTIEDVAQDAFARALGSGLFGFREDRRSGSLERALVVVVEHVLADHLRRIGSLKRGANQLPDSLDDSGPETQDPILRELVSSVTTPTANARSSELLALCKEHLNEREWEVWRLRVVAGLDFEDIAALTQGTPASVRGIAHRAKKKLIIALAKLDTENNES